MEKRYLSIWLCVVLVFISILPKVSVKASSQDEIVYLDGIAFEYYVDYDGNMNIKSLDADNYGSMIVYTDGTADVVVSDDKYFLEIDNLSENVVDIKVYDKDKEIVEEYSEINEIIEDDYECQEAITVMVLSLKTFLEVLITVAKVVIIASATCYAVSEVYTAIKEDGRKKNYYYKAWQERNGVYIDYANPISIETATLRISAGKSIYTWTSTMAKQVVDRTGLGCIIQSEIDKNRKEGNIYYYHWHTANRNGAHAWFGRPYTV